MRVIVIVLFAALSVCARAENFPLPDGRTVYDVYRYAADKGMISEIGGNIREKTGGLVYWDATLTNAYPTAALCDYSASPTNSGAWWTNVQKDATVSFSTVDPTLKAYFLGFMDAVNAHLAATNQITAAQVKAAVKARLP